MSNQRSRNACKNISKLTMSIRRSQSTPLIQNQKTRVKSNSNRKGTVQWFSSTSRIATQLPRNRFSPPGREARPTGDRIINSKALISHLKWTQIKRLATCSEGAARRRGRITRSTLSVRISILRTTYRRMKPISASSEAHSLDELQAADPATDESIRSRWSHPWAMAIGRPPQIVLMIVWTSLSSHNAVCSTTP